MSTTAFFAASSMPLRKAACEPKLRECVMPSTRGFAALSARIASSESSGLPSLTKMIS